MMKISATLLILSSLLGVKAQIPGMFHRESFLTVCSDTEDSYKEYVIGLDGEVLAYTDFITKKEVYPQPSFIDPIAYGPDIYGIAVNRVGTCIINLNVARSAYKNPPVKQEQPDSKIFSKDEAELGVTNVLVCHVTGFYPAPVSVTWTRNTLNLTDDITDDITSSVPQLDQDGSFQQFFRLKITAEQGDVYSCTVNHQSLSSPETRWWDVDHHVPAPPSMAPAVFLGVGLTLGLLGVAMGTFFLIKGNQCN